MGGKRGAGGSTGEVRGVMFGQGLSNAGSCAFEQRQSGVGRCFLSGAKAIGAQRLSGVWVAAT